MKPTLRPLLWEPAGPWPIKGFPSHNTYLFFFFPLLRDAIELVGRGRLALESKMVKAGWLVHEVERVGL